VDPARELHEALRAGGADFAAYLPDSVFFGATTLLERDPGVHVVVCSREDEGVAVAVGAYLGGRTPVVLMEGSGLGYCGLILTRASVQRTPMLVLASHTPALGEPHDYHAASRLVGEGLARGLGLPHATIPEARLIRTMTTAALETMRGQKTPVCLFVPPYVLREVGA
jgi:sulfopyruvate decarboxylase TPP-binding subunit